MSPDTDVVDSPTSSPSPSATSPRSPAPDAALAAAVEVARAAAVEIAEPGAVGEHLGVEPEGDRVLTHFFGCLSAGYRGWRWAVTVARAPRSRTVTVSEVHLLPDGAAVLSPSWLPWAERIQPGDLAPGMVLPKVLDDVRLEQGFEATGDEDVDAVALWELGLGRPRVLSLEGRDEAAQRWYAGSHGPRDPFAEQAPAPCASCGFFLPMAGALRAVFGVCANEWSPSDGQVVSLDHGCGAHSEVDVEARTETVDAPVLDETGYVEIDVERGPRAELGDVVEPVDAVEPADAVKPVEVELPAAIEVPAGFEAPQAEAQADAVEAGDEPDAAPPQP